MASSESAAQPLPSVSFYFEPEDMDQVVAVLGDPASSEPCPDEQASVWVPIDPDVQPYKTVTPSGDGYLVFNPRMLMSTWALDKSDAIEQLQAARSPVAKDAKSTAT